jgi:hypothetical protein
MTNHPQPPPPGDSDAPDTDAEMDETAHKPSAEQIDPDAPANAVLFPDKEAPEPNEPG